jgi:hypothetical protein
MITISCLLLVFSDLLNSFQLLVLGFYARQIPVNAKTTS